MKGRGLSRGPLPFKARFFEKPLGAESCQTRVLSTLESKRLFRLAF